MDGREVQVRYGDTFVAVVIYAFLFLDYIHVARKRFDADAD